MLGLLLATVLPGHALMRALGWFPGARSARERIPLAFGVGYGILAVLCALSAAAHFSLTQAAVVLSMSTLALAAAPSTSLLVVDSERAGSAISRALMIAVVFVVVCGWLLEPPVTGEETVELISIRKIAENPFISVDGIMPEPRTIPTYVITPYYFFVALVAKASGVSIFVAYLKLRAAYAGLSLMTFTALAARLFPRDGSRLADAIALGFAAFFVADPDPWTWPASLMPLVRRGSFGAGVVAPVFMLAMLVYVTRIRSEKRPVADWVAPGLLLLTVLTTHAMEIIYVGFFATAIVAARLLIPRSTIAWSRIVSFGLSAASVAVVYKAVHVRLAAHTYAFDQAAQAQALATLKAELAAGLVSWWGISDAGRYLISASGAVVPYTLLGILLVPILIRRESAGATIVWAAAVIPLLVYCSSKLFVLLQLATSSEILFVFGYFTLLGTMAFLAVLFGAVDTLLMRAHHVAAASAPRLAGSVALAAVVGYVILGPLLRLAARALIAYPLTLPWIAAIAGLVAVWRWRTAHPDGERPTASGTTIVFVAVVAGVAFAARGSGRIESPRQPVWQNIARAWQTPSVLDWAAYYPILRTSSNPPIDLPAHIVADIERLLPPLQTLIADPAHSFSLPVVLNQHIVNPGHVISTSLKYFDRYARSDAAGIRTHPIFNQSETLSDEERRFLDEYAVQYLLVNPRYHAVVRRKLEAEPGLFELVYERDGFLLYRRSTRD